MDAPRPTYARLELALVLLFVAVVGPFVHPITAQSGARYALTAGIVEQHSIVLDDYAPIIGFDRVERDGHLYSDKAPGQPFLGVPVLAVAEALGADQATDYQIDGNLGLWSQVLAFCVLPGALLMILMFRHARRKEDPYWALVAALGLSWTTMLLPFSTNLYGHVFAATLLFGAWHLATDERRPPGLMWAAGTLAALATLVEYPSFALAAAIGAWVLLDRGFWAAVRFSAPHLVTALLLVAYHELAFGSTASGYSQKGGGRLNFIGMPDPGHAFQILFGLRGFVFTPIVLVGLVGLVIGLRRRRFELLVPAACFLVLFVLQAGWGNPWGGEGPGPRYVLAALPFLVVPVALLLPAMSPLLRRVVLVVGAVSMGLATVTEDLVAHGDALIAAHIRTIADQGLSPTVFTIALGPAGWILHLGLVALALRAVVRQWPTVRAAPRPAGGP